MRQRRESVLRALDCDARSSVVKPEFMLQTPSIVLPSMMG
jgi:hypothetical protein